MSKEEIEDLLLDKTLSQENRDYLIGLKAVISFKSLKIAQLEEEIKKKGRNYFFKEEIEELINRIT